MDLANETIEIQGGVDVLGVLGFRALELVELHSRFGTAMGDP